MHKLGPVLSLLGSVVFSVISFHGRGFFPGGIGLDDPLTVVDALEAFIGLLIEVYHLHSSGIPSPNSQYLTFALIINIFSFDRVIAV